MVKSGIRYKLVLAFLLVGIIPSVTIGLLSVLDARNALKSSGQDRITDMAGLEAIADLKGDKIKSFFQERSNDITTVQGYYIIKTILPIVTQFADDRANPAYIEAKKLLVDQLKTFQAVYDYIDIMLVSPEGKIVYVTNEEHAARDLDGPLPGLEGMAFEEGKKGIYLSDIFTRKGSVTDFEMLITAPAYDFDGTFIGLIALDVDMIPIYKFIQDTIGLGETGEILVGKNMGDHVLFLNPLRFDPDAALKRKVTYGKMEAFPIQEATQGRNGSGESIDYRGKKTLAVWRYLPSLEWGIVAKIDYEEIIEQTNKTTFSIGLITALFALFVVLVALIISNTITRPINKLTKVISDISTGKLDIEIAPELKESRDEIGDLARAFDRTLISLKLAMKKGGMRK